VTSDNDKKDSVSSQRETNSGSSSIFSIRISPVVIPLPRDSSISTTVGPSTSLPGQSSAKEVKTVKSDKSTRQDARWKDHLKKGKGKKDRKSDSDKRGKRKKSSYFEIPEDRYDSLTGMSIPMYPQRKTPSPPPSRPVPSYPTTSTTSSSPTTTPSTSYTTLHSVTSPMNRNDNLIIEVRQLSLEINPKPNQKINLKIKIPLFTKIALVN